MILSVLSRSMTREPILEALEESAHDANGNAGEDRLVLSGVSWDRYGQIDAALGEDRPQPRLYYLAGELEIMTTSLLHERIKKWLAMLVEDYLYEAGIETFTHGQATMKVLEEAGAEPDESWCFGQEKQYPDLVLEIVLTSGGIDKLDIYRRFQVPEVWLWRKGAVEIWTLRKDKSAYAGPSKKSRLLPGLDLALLSQCLGLDSWQEARRTFRQALTKRRR
jgi:Uma2 family endonuclease